MYYTGKLQCYLYAIASRNEGVMEQRNTFHASAQVFMFIPFLHDDLYYWLYALSTAVVM
jgi:hypothetical protein